MDYKKIINRGTGAGGTKTNENGLKFEKEISVEKVLEEEGFARIIFDKTSNGFFLQKVVDGKRFIFLKQAGFKKYMKKTYGKDVLSNPDEAFVVAGEDKSVKVFVIEKKNQNTSGSVDQKLWASVGIRFEYRHVLGDDIEVNYGLSLSSWFENQFETRDRYKTLDIHLKQEKIPYFFANKESYFDNLLRWVGINS